MIHANQRSGLSPLIQAARGGSPRDRRAFEHKRQPDLRPPPGGSQLRPAKPVFYCAADFSRGSTSYLAVIPAIMWSLMWQ